MTRRAVVSTLLLPAIMAWVTACFLDNSGPGAAGTGQNPDDTLPSGTVRGLVVSHPVPGIGAVSSTGRIVASDALASSGLVFVSLMPGSVPTGLRATIRDRATGVAVTTLLEGGGFDPVPIAASDGDTLAVDVVVIGSTTPLQMEEVVLANRPPVIVRTSPPKGGHDVPLNSFMVIVFSVPMDSVTVTTNSIRLLRGSIPIPVLGTVEFADSTHLTAEFRPTAPLSPQTTYQLVATQAIQDVDGIALASALSTSFTTGSYPLPSVVSIAPAGAPQGGAAFTLTVNGSGFVPASIVEFGATALASTYVDSTRVTAAVPASAIATAGMVALSVTNPTPGGGTSYPVNFVIGAPGTPLPFSVSPTSLDFGTQPVGTISAPRSVTITNASSVPEALSVLMNGENWTDYRTDNVCPRVLDAGASCTIGIEFMPSVKAAEAGIFVISMDSPQQAQANLVGTGSGGLSLTVAPSRSGQVGKFLYTPDATTNSVSMYAIDSATGALKPLVPNRIGAGFQPVSVAVDPSGRFVYVANEGSNNVSMFTIDSATGALAELASPVPAESGPVSVAVAPDVTGKFGKFVYVVNSSARSVSIYTADSATGALTPSGRFAPAGRGPVSVAIQPSGKFAYVASNGCLSGLNTCVWTFVIDPTTGALTRSGPVYGDGMQPSSMAIDPSGRFLAVVNADASSEVLTFGIDTTNGTLAFTSFLPTFHYPSAVTIDASSRFVYETTAGPTSPPCSAFSNCSAVWMFSVDASEHLTLLGNVAAGLYPGAIVTDQSGRFAYVANVESQNISMYSIGVDGTLTLIGTIGL